MCLEIRCTRCNFYDSAGYNLPLVFSCEYCMDEFCENCDYENGPNGEYYCSLDCLESDAENDEEE